MAIINGRLIFNVIFLICNLIPISYSQVAESPSSEVCNGIFVSYAYTSGSKIKPTESDSTKQPYRFESTLTVINNDDEELQSWKVFVGFQHNEILVSASNAVLYDSSSLPASVGNGTVFAGYPQTDLKTAIETAGDLSQMGVQVNLVGTQFGVASPSVPMPQNISLANDGYSCPKSTMQGTNEMQVCCPRNPNSTTNSTVIDKFLPRQSGDLTIMYDVIRTYVDNYWALVTISNHNPLGRLDNWKLSWDWMNDEFIFTMKGAYPSVVDSSDCIFGSQGQYYAGMDFSNVLNCQQRPTIVDLPPTKANDTTLGLIPYCCRNGTILPPTMDPSKSTSAFQMQVYKMPPNLNRSELSPPQNWQISGTLNPDYQCGSPVRVSPSQFPDPSGLPSNSTAFASWQVVCNITENKKATPKCCVSFSAYYNESVVPCRTCACGCASNPSNTCSTTEPALLLPSEALLVPFENRTAYARAYYNLKHRTLPNPLPCGDNCGVSINWHVYTDYSRGWTARITLFNWDDTAFADWFVAVELDKAAAGFQKTYSFNGSLLDGVNNTIFMQGLSGLNYLVAETDGANPEKDYRVPGKQQSVISFTKTKTPGIDVPAGDGFPTKVYFNGDECLLPTILPSNGHQNSAASFISFALAVFVLMLLKQ
ncbi:COBRA, plant [Dillenia turbinata]|uniref:COBRA, plant n=1 Tax=Dillenia turbinata TaxID=194707 RepID=A0AAN8VI52_9MAGN